MLDVRRPGSRRVSTRQAPVPSPRSLCVILHIMKIRHLIVALFVVATSAAAQTGTPADLSAKVDQIVADAMRKQQIPAMTVAVAMGDRMVYSKASGAADLENAVSATTQTPLRTGPFPRPSSPVIPRAAAISMNMDKPRANPNTQQ